jgi:NHL repeat
MSFMTKKTTSAWSAFYSLRYLAIAFALCLTAFLALTASASAAIPFCLPGSGAGQCERPEMVAVNPETGHVYVADRANNRIDVFEADGDFVLAFGWGVDDGSAKAQTCTTASGCQKGLAGKGAGQFEAPTQKVAVDPTSPHAVYVFNGFRVQKFDPDGSFLTEFGSQGTGKCQFASDEDPITVGPGGVVYVGDSVFVKFENGEDKFATRIEKFAGTTACLNEVPLSTTHRLRALAVNSLGYIYVAIEFGGIAIEKYDASGIPVYELGEGIETAALAVDEADHLFAAQREGSARVITEYGPADDTLSRFGYGQIESRLSGLAPYQSPQGDVFAADDTAGIKYLSVPKGPVVSPPAEAGAGNTKATLEAQVNPEGRQTTFHFEYVDQESFEKEGGFASPKTKSTAESTLVGADFTLDPASASIGCAKPQSPPQVSCLTPETTYRFRVVVANADGKAELEGAPFTTLAPLAILDSFATEVGTDAAQLHAIVNPLGIPAEGYFEYVSDATYRQDVEEAGPGHGFDHALRVPAEGEELDFGAGEAPVGAIAPATSLSAGTLYHFRLVARDPFISLAGPEGTFTTTQHPTPPLSPDPCSNAAFRGGASANLPDCRAYEMVSPLKKGNSDIAVLLSVNSFPAGFEQAATDGNRISYSSATAFGDAPSSPYTSQYLARRQDGVGWSTHGISPPRGSLSVTGSYAARYDVQYKAFSESLGAGWLFQDADPPLDECGVPGYPNLYRRDNASGAYEALTTVKPSNQAAVQYTLELQGLSADGGTAVFAANGKLTSDAANSGGWQLYEHVAGEGCGEVRLVSALPSGKGSTLEPTAGTVHGFRGEARANTVARAVSADGTKVFWTAGNLSGPGTLYLHSDGEKTVEVASGSEFLTAAKDGSRAIYRKEAQLFEFDTATKTSIPIAGEIGSSNGGVAAASEDATRLYFVSKEALEGEGEAGKPNLYLREGTGAASTTKLVGTLAVADLTGDFPLPALSVTSPEPNKRGTRTTPDGGHLAFVSTAPLTGYDNRDGEDGSRDVELFVYDAGTGDLACVSCNPGGGRPLGRFLDGLNGAQRRVSAQLSAWQNDLYASRALSQDGDRLFFESFEALVSRDTNGKADVYEWQRAGDSRACEERGAELFVKSAGGCLSLISSGESPIDSQFVDASPDGRDVFIKTASSLIPQDPGLVDIYDARQGGGLPAPTLPPPACEGEACQGPAAPPDDPTPASSSFNAGNPTPTSACPKGKRQVRRAGRPRCVAKHKKHRPSGSRRQGGQK